MTGSGAEDRATTEAAHWLVALDDDPDDLALRARFQAWLDASPANVAAWKDTADIDALTARLPAAYEAHWKPYRADRTASPSQPASMKAPTAFARRPRSLILGGAAAAVAACVAIMAAPTILLRMEADHVTATGELRSVRLDDGSTVRIGPGSAIAVTFTADARAVRLLKGEAFFDVAPNPSRPFRVRAGAIETTVLGTAFDVRLDAGAVAVEVSHGRVQVDHTGSQPPVSERLEAGHWTRMSSSGETARGRLGPEEVAAWMRGQIVARDRALSDVVSELRRSYGGMIVMADETLAQQRVTGVYNVANPIGALQAMVAAHGGNVRQISPWLLVVSRP